jgi:hypothetical protein
MKYIVILLIALLTFSSCKSDLSEEQKQEYTVKGKEIAQATMKELAGNLMKQMKLGGPKLAVPFCNAAAYPLTDKIAKKYNVSIKRTSHKIRNPKNSPNSEESKIIKNYLVSLDKEESIKPVVKIEADKKVHFYAPIILDKKCIACHGTVGKEVSKQTDSIIKSFYPTDKATGFKVGDLRGVWSITFNN